MLTIWTNKIKHSTVGSSFSVTFSVAPNESEYLDKLYDCFSSMNWSSFPITADRKTENSSEIPNNCEECKHWNDTEDDCADRHGCRATTEDCSMVEPQTEMPRCSVNGTPFDECGFCEYFNCDTCKCEADVPQTELKGSKRLLKGKTEETEMERLERIDNELEDAWARIRELTDEPQK